MSDVYVEQGYKNRNDYLQCLADDHGVDVDTVRALAHTYGPEEDFDALVSAVEDVADGAM